MVPNSLARLIHELRTRKVFRAAGVYAVVAFIVVQVADIVFPALQLPGWTVTLVVALALLGFPVALVLAWAYDLTPDGVSRADAAQPAGGGGGSGLRRGLTGGLGLGILVGLVAIAGLTYVRGEDDTGAGSSAAIRSIAVLPFENLSVEEENAFFAAGMHDEVLTHLGRIADLQVISRTSVLPYAGSPKSMREIGRELGVRAILEGSVQRHEGQIRVTAVLIDAETDRQLWAERYDRGLEDVFALQTEIALSIAGALEAELTPEERRRVERQAPTQDLEAFRQYVLGMGQLDQRGAAAMRRSIPFLERAIARDSSYAEAWAGLANAHTLLHDYGYAAPEEVLPVAESAIRRVEALDPELAHVPLAGLYMTRQEWQAAIRELRRAVEVQPGNADAHSWRSWVSLLLGLEREALEAARAAVEIDPLHHESVSNLVFSLMANGKPESALRVLRDRQGTSAAFTTEHLYEGWILYALGRPAEAVTILDGLEAVWALEGARALLILSLVALGDTAAARAALSELDAEADPFSAGVARLALGEVAAALGAFGRVDDVHGWPNLALRYLPAVTWDPVRGDPRFERLLRQLPQATPR